MHKREKHTLDKVKLCEAEVWWGDESVNAGYEYEAEEGEEGDEGYGKD